MRHDGCVGIASASDGVTQISVVEDPAGDGEQRPKEDVVQSPMAKRDSASAAVNRIAASQRPVVHRR